MKRRNYYVLGLAITVTVFFGWLVAVTVEGEIKRYIEVGRDAGFV